MSLHKLLTEDRRLVMLRFLAEDPSYSLNTSLLHDALLLLGHSASRDQVETDAVWLAEQGLVTVEHVQSVTVARLTPRGLDAAKGLAVIPGVARPGPRHGGV